MRKYDIDYMQHYIDREASFVSSGKKKRSTITCKLGKRSVYEAYIRNMLGVDSEVASYFDSFTGNNALTIVVDIVRINERLTKNKTSFFIGVGYEPYHHSDNR